MLTELLSADLENWNAFTMGDERASDDPSIPALGMDVTFPRESSAVLANVGAGSLSTGCCASPAFVEKSSRNDTF